MIEQYFASKRPQIVAPIHRHHRHTPVVHAITHSVNSAPSAFETSRAEKMGLTVEVYRHRVTEVSRAQSECKFQVGDTVWPAEEADVEKYGMCQVVGVCRHYNDYGTVDWNEPPFILSVQTLSDRSVMLNTTANWVVKVKPVYVLENMGDC